MTHDPNDTHVDKDAFWAAYNALQAHGVSLAEVRGVVANHVAVVLLDRRTQHGLGHMLTLAQGTAPRRSAVLEIANGLPEEFTSVSYAALDAAIAAAARSLAG